MRLLSVIVFVIIILAACGSTSEKEKEENATESDPVSNENSDEENWDDLKDEDKIIGKSDKDYSGVSKNKPTKVRNDTTGNWKKSTISKGVDIEEYALSYQDLHMEEDEVHHIINFAHNTTTWLNEMNGLLYVDVKEYVDKEEHDASTLGSGMLLKSYVIFPDGDIQESEDEKQTFEINEEMELGNIKIELQNVYIEDNELSFGFWWSHWASNEKTHFSYFAYLVVSQNGEELKQQDDKDTLLRQAEKGVDSRVDLTYKLQDDSPIKIKFKTSSDDPEEKEITVNIK